MSLCKTFRDLSNQTWMKLDKARAVKHQMLEESITDLLMIELKSRHPYEIITKTFSRNQEGENGADWEWWFVDGDEKKGIGFRIQAKIINFKSNCFEQLHYHKKNGVYQKDLLINKAKESKLIPLYCLYLNQDTENNIEWILRLEYGENILGYQDYGCSILSISDLKDLGDKKKFEDIIEKVFPWHQLVCSSKNCNSSISLLNNISKFVSEKKLHQDLKNVEEIDLPHYVVDIIEKGPNVELHEKESDVDLRGIIIIKDSKD